MLLILLTIFTLSVFGEGAGGAEAAGGAPAEAAAAAPAEAEAVVVPQCAGEVSKCTLRCETSKDRCTLKEGEAPVDAPDCKDDKEAPYCSMPACPCTPVDESDNALAPAIMNAAWMSDADNAYKAKFCSKLSYTMCDVSEVCGVFESADEEGEATCYSPEDDHYDDTLSNYFRHEDRCRCERKENDDDAGTNYDGFELYCSALGWDGCKLSEKCHLRGYSTSTSQVVNHAAQGEELTLNPCLSRDGDAEITQYTITFTGPAKYKFSIHLLEEKIAKWFSDLIVIDDPEGNYQDTKYPAYGPNNIYVHPDVEWDGAKAKIFFSMLTNAKDGGRIFVYLEKIPLLSAKILAFFNQFDQSKGALSATLTSSADNPLVDCKDADLGYADAGDIPAWIDTFPDNGNSDWLITPPAHGEDSQCAITGKVALIECEDCKCENARMRYSSLDGDTVEECALKAFGETDPPAYFNFLDLPIYGWSNTKLKVKGSRCVYTDYTKKIPKKDEPGKFTTIEGKPHTYEECVTNRLTPGSARDPTAVAPRGVNPKPWSIYKLYGVCTSCKAADVGMFEVCKNCKCDGSHHYQHTVRSLAEEGNRAEDAEACAAKALAVGHYYFSFKEGPGYCVFGMEESSPLACADNRIYTKSPHWMIGYAFCKAA